MVEQKCKTCDKSFLTYKSRIVSGKGKYCSKTCYTKQQINKPLSETHKQKLSEAKMGELNSFYGKSHSPESIAKIIKKKSGQRCSPATEFKPGQKPWNVGIPHLVGEKHPQWKGGISKMPDYSRVHTARRRLRIKEGGHYSVQEWLDMKEKYNFMCLCCKKQEPFIKLSPDHVVPLARGGTNTIDNIQPLCCGCNGRKWAKTVDYRNSITSKWRLVALDA